MEQHNQAALVTSVGGAGADAAGHGAHGAHGAHGGRDHVPHVLPMNRYLGVWAALLTLTGITVAVSYFDFGEWNIVVSLLVASVKATLVAAIFMHLAYDKKFNAIVLLIAVLFLAVLIALTMSDTMTRSIGDPIEGARANDYTQPFNAGKPAPKGEPVPAKDAPKEIEVPHLPR